MRIPIFVLHCDGIPHSNFTYSTLQAPFASAADSAGSSPSLGLRPLQGESASSAFANTPSTCRLPYISFPGQSTTHGITRCTFDFRLHNKMDTESTWRQTQQQQQQQHQQHQHLMALQQQRRYLHMHQTQQLQHAQQQAILGGLGLTQQQHQRQHQQQQVQQAQQEQQAAQQQQQAAQQPHHHHHHQQQQQQQVQQQALVLEAASGLPPLPPQARQQLAATLGGQLGVGTVEKVTALEAGACVRRLMQFMHAQRRRPQDNSIEFWRLFVAEYFRPGSKKRWCISSYNNYARQPVGVFPQDLWHCELCGASAGRGFETTVEVLPRLFKIKYDSGVQEELLYIDLPSEHPLGSSHVVLQYKNAVLESVFDQLRVVRYGQLRVVFTLDLKIQSWEFCTQSHEELIPRRLISNPVVQLANMAVKCQGQNASTLSTMQLQNQLNEFISMSKQLAAKVDTPTVNDLGFTKRYVRCLQISEVVNSMKDLIAFDDDHKLGPIKSLQAFPRMNVQTQSALDTPGQAALHSLQQGVSGQTMLTSNAIPGGPSRGSVLAASATAGSRSLLQQQQLTSSLASLSNSSLCHQNSALASLQASIQASAMAGQMGTAANVPQLTNLQLTTGGNNGNVSGHQEATNAMVQQLMQQMLSVQQQQTAGSGGSGLGPPSPSPFSANGISSASSLLGSFADHITTSFNGVDASDPTAGGIQDLSSSLPPHPSPSASLGPPSASTPASSTLQGNSIGSGIGIGPANSNPTCAAIIPGGHSGAGNPGSGGLSNAGNKALRNLNSFVDSFIAGGGSSLGALSDGLGTGATSSRGGPVGAGNVGGLGAALDDLGGGVLGGLSTSPGGVGGVGVGDLPMDDTAESLLGTDAGSLAGLGSLGSGDHPFGNLGNLSDFNWKSP